MPPIHEILLGLLAGLVLFLFGVSRLADGLRAIAGDRMRTLLSRFTTNRLAGVATGTAACTVLDSSSVTIILVIALVDAGALTFVQSLGVILGANIGTTVSSQIIAFDVERWAPLAMAAGLGLQLLGRSERARAGGIALLGIGLVLFGLGYMGEVVEPLRDAPRFRELMTRMERPLVGALVGAVVTVIIQSSSATLGIVITLASQGLVSLPAGIAIMLGAEIGTCADTLFATIGRSRPAVRAGLFHLLFNVTCVAVGLLLVEPFTALVRQVPGQPGVARQIANAHLLFNAMGVLLALPWLAPIARGLQRVIPDADGRRTATYERQPGVPASAG